MPECRECGSPFESSRRDADFCCSKCRMEYHQRRAIRGAQLYDLFMALRHQRGLAKTLGLYGIICRMASTWREQDYRQRDGRRSWDEPERVLERHPQHRTVTFNL